MTRTSSTTCASERYCLRSWAPTAVIALAMTLPSCSSTRSACGSPTAFTITTRWTRCCRISLRTNLPQWSKGVMHLRCHSTLAKASKSCWHCWRRFDAPLHHLIHHFLFAHLHILSLQRPILFAYQYKLYGNRHARELIRAKKKEVLYTHLFLCL